MDTNESMSVGSMMPITTPDQVLHKQDPMKSSLIDEEYQSLRIFNNPKGDEDSNDEEFGYQDSEFDESVKEEKEVSLSDFKMRRNGISHYDNPRLDGSGLRKVEKYFKDLDGGFVPYRKLKKVRAQLKKEDNQGHPPLKKDDTFFLYAKDKKVGVFRVTVDRDDNFSLQYTIESHYSKYFPLYYPYIAAKYSAISAKDNKKIYKWMFAISQKKEPVLESAEDVISITQETSHVRDILEGTGVDVVSYTVEDPCVFESVDDGDFFTEAAKIDDDIKDIIKTLNEKGYETLYSCSGHPSARSKSDVYRDGVKNDKLYSSARIVFAEAYPFPNIPTGWKKKVMEDEGEKGKETKVGIYVKPPTFNIINGLPTEQFYAWKKKYMYHLEKWVKDLPKKEELNSSDNAKVAVESVNDVFDELLVQTMLTD